MSVKMHSNDPFHEDIAVQRGHGPRPADGGKLIVLTAPLTEAIDHAGYFIQMAMASLPIWMEGVINRKYPKWREVEHNEDGSAKYMPAGVRLVEKSLLANIRAGRHRLVLSRGSAKSLSARERASLPFRRTIRLA